MCLRRNRTSIALLQWIVILWTAEVIRDKDETDDQDQQQPAQQEQPLNGLTAVIVIDHALTVSGIVPVRL
jgi:hypothetical protein